MTQTSQSGTGTIHTAVSNAATTTIIIASANGQVFDSTADLVIDVAGTSVTVLADDITASSTTGDVATVCANVTDSSARTCDAAAAAGIQTVTCITGFVSCCCCYFLHCKIYFYCKRILF